jgi:hypothetical protein
MKKYVITATATIEYFLEVEADSAEQAREQVQYLSPDKWISDGYEFSIGYVEEVTD